jgi:hypothetical protein
MTTRLSIWGEAGKVYVDRQELQIFLTGTQPIPRGYRAGWTVRHITDLTEPVSFYLRGEEYSAQLESFGRAVAGKRETQRNSFESAAETDATIEMIERRASTAPGAPSEAGVAGAPKSILARVFNR